ncbi:MAG TPA: M20/M25/M40 family metallo-hydrolase [Phenylobacterium sp.]|jgi:acetylornithine deacetylase/succinyl-diaminopimelate desuccinylase-like protein|uniref:M20/M25/M40 family metallo-hydrolase n=1 Tax=Phenylobacterium sp. TaxID=1871053 RepID=UPI002BD282A9|nr:M20/M25/M40 family metallo-hydrolase [Phenylobacterium sp.]HXA39125.1 M20/M25/M40 family metallo-hydrolase [Phenylobacterium sp.]
MLRTLAVSVALGALLGSSALAQGAAPRPDQLEYRALYKELVETNTTLSAGSCTLAAERMAAHLKAAGFPDTDLHPFAAPDHPKEGGLVAILPGRDPKAKAVLMLAHLDVVEAKREDWTRDPFTLVEENGNFYARGAADDKAMASIWVDTLVRYKKEGFKPRRTLKMALTCGEETNGAFNGAEYLAKNKRDLIDAAFAVNEGGGGLVDANGKPVFQGIQVGEKLSQNFTLEVTNPGGHSSRPLPDNAIYHLANALVKIQGYRFPVMFSDTTRDFYARMAKTRTPEEQAAIAALLKNPRDEGARAILEKDPDNNAILHTNCVATMLDAGHATNALPQRARANINCRIFPGTSAADVQATLEQAIGDPKVKVSVREIRNAVSPPPPLDPKVLGPAEKLAAEMWPGVPQVREMSAGATDGAFLTPVGIPTYGISGDFGDPDGDGVHGLNERIRVKVLYDSRDYLYRLMKIYADQAD